MSPDRSRRGLFLAGGVAILVASLLVLLWLAGLVGGRGNPSYKGKTLRQWIDEGMGSQNASMHAQTIASVRAIGTNALPALIDWMVHRDADYQREFYQFLISKRAIRWAWPALMGNNEGSCECRALIGFYALGPEARPALPSLERLVRAKDSARPSKPANAAMAYVYVDPSQAERLAEQWGSSTNQELITAASRLRDALASVQAMVASSNKIAAPNAGPVKVK